ncbi:DUF4231 domain-containing protein [Flavobacterium sp. 3HN19-14]|uniref:DUF4231 domain-containing protein n=1 Tax=Flavobacterium sp. 3HN19-14 TaxID=3448133 RepID=UPI003EE3149E
MDIQQYITERVDGQTSWYSAKSRSNKTNYTRTKVALTIIAAVIPALTAYIGDEVFKTLIAILSVAMAVLANISTIFNFKDNWTKYRNMSEILKSEKNIFLAGAGKYTDAANPEQVVC